MVSRPWLSVMCSGFSLTLTLTQNPYTLDAPPAHEQHRQVARIYRLYQEVVWW